MQLVCVLYPTFIIKIIFLNFCRDAIKKEHPEYAITEIAKAAGEKWKTLDEDVKKKYEDKQKEMKEKYEETYKEWLDNGGREAIKDAKGGKSGKSPKKKAAPKDPSGGTGGSFQSKEFIEESGSDSD